MLNDPDRYESLKSVYAAREAVKSARQDITGDKFINLKQLTKNKEAFNTPEGVEKFREGIDILADKFVAGYKEIHSHRTPTAQPTFKSLKSDPTGRPRTGFISRGRTEDYLEFVSVGSDNEDAELRMAMFQFQESSVLQEVLNRKDKNTEILTQDWDYSTGDSVSANILAGNYMSKTIADKVNQSDKIVTTQKSGISSFHPKVGYVDSGDKDIRELYALFGTQNITTALEKNNTMESLLILDAKAAEREIKRTQQDYKFSEGKYHKDTKSLFDYADNIDDDLERRQYQAKVVEQAIGQEVVSLTDDLLEASKNSENYDNKQLRALRENKKESQTDQNLSQRFTFVNQEILGEYNRVLSIANRNSSQIGKVYMTVNRMEALFSGNPQDSGIIKLKQELLRLAKNNKLQILTDRFNYTNYINNARANGSNLDSDFMNELVRTGAVKFMPVMQHEKGIAITNTDNKLMYGGIQSANQSAPALVYEDEQSSNTEVMLKVENQEFFELSLNDRGEKAGAQFEQVKNEYVKQSVYPEIDDPWDSPTAADMAAEISARNTATELWDYSPWNLDSETNNYDIENSLSNLTYSTKQDDSLPNYWQTGATDTNQPLLPSAPFIFEGIPDFWGNEDTSNYTVNFPSSENNIQTSSELPDYWNPLPEEDVRDRIAREEASQHASETYNIREYEPDPSLSKYENYRESLVHQKMQELGSDSPTTAKAIRTSIDREWEGYDEYLQSLGYLEHMQVYSQEDVRTGYSIEQNANSAGVRELERRIDLLNKQIGKGGEQLFTYTERYAPGEYTELGRQRGFDEPVGLRVRINPSYDSPLAGHGIEIDLTVNSEGNVILSDLNKVINNTLIINQSDQDVDLPGGLETLGAGQAQQLDSLETTLGLLTTMSSELGHQARHGLAGFHFNLMTEKDIGKASRGATQVFADLITDYAKTKGLNLQTRSGTPPTLEQLVSVLPSAKDPLSNNNGLSLDEVFVHVVDYASTHDLVTGEEIKDQDLIKKKKKALTNIFQDIYSLKTNAEVSGDPQANIELALQLTGQQIDGFNPDSLAGRLVLTLAKDLNETPVLDDIRTLTILQDEEASEAYNRAARTQSRTLIDQVFESFLSTHDQETSYMQSKAQLTVWGVRQERVDREDDSVYGRVTRLGVMDPAAYGHSTYLGPVGSVQRMLASTASGDPATTPGYGGLAQVKGISNTDLHTGAAKVYDMETLMTGVSGYGYVNLDDYRQQLILLDIKTNYPNFKELATTQQRAILEQTKQRVNLVIEQEQLDSPFTYTFQGSKEEKQVPLYFIPYDKAEQITQRFKNVTGSRAAKDINPAVFQSILEGGQIDNEVIGQLWSGNLRAALPPQQWQLVQQYRAELQEAYGDTPITYEQLIQFLRKRDIDPLNQNKGIVGSNKLKRVAIHSGFNTLGDYSAFNAGFEQPTGETKRVKVNIGLGNIQSTDEIVRNLGKFMQQGVKVVGGDGMYIQIRDSQGQPVLDPDTNKPYWEKVGTFTDTGLITINDSSFYKYISSDGTLYKEPITMKFSAYGKSFESGVSVFTGENVNIERSARGTLIAEQDVTTISDRHSGFRPSSGGALNKAVQLVVGEEVFTEIGDVLETRTSLKDGGRLSPSSETATENVQSLATFSQFKGFTYETGYSLIVDPVARQGLSQVRGGDTARALSLLFLGDNEVQSALSQSLINEDNSTLAYVVENLKSKKLRDISDPHQSTSLRMIMKSLASVTGHGGSVNDLKLLVTAALRGDTEAQSILEAGKENLFNIVLQDSEYSMRIGSESGEERITLNEANPVVRGAGMLAHVMYFGNQMFKVPGQGQNSIGTLYDTQIDADTYMEAIRKEATDEPLSEGEKVQKNLVELLAVHTGVKIDRRKLGSEKGDREIRETVLLLQAAQQRDFVLETIVDTTVSKSLVSAGQKDEVAFEFHYFIGLSQEHISKFRDTRVGEELGNVQEAYSTLIAAVSGGFHRTAFKQIGISLAFSKQKTKRQLEVEYLAKKLGWDQSLINAVLDYELLSDEQLREKYKGTKVHEYIYLRKKHRELIDYLGKNKEIDKEFKNLHSKYYEEQSYFIDKSEINTRRAALRYASYQRGSTKKSDLYTNSIVGILTDEDNQESYLNDLKDRQERNINKGVTSDIYMDFQHGMSTAQLKIKEELADVQREREQLEQQKKEFVSQQRNIERHNIRDDLRSQAANIDPNQDLIIQSGDDTDTSSLSWEEYQDHLFDNVIKIREDKKDYYEEIIPGFTELAKINARIYDLEEKERKLKAGQASLNRTKQIVIPNIEIYERKDASGNVIVGSYEYSIKSLASGHKPTVGVLLGNDLIQNLSLVFGDHKDDAIIKQREFILALSEAQPILDKLQSAVSLDQPILSEYEVSVIRNLEETAMATRETLTNQITNETMRKALGEHEKFSGAVGYAMNSFAILGDQAVLGDRFSRIVGDSKVDQVLLQQASLIAREYSRYQHTGDIDAQEGYSRYVQMLTDTQLPVAMPLGNMPDSEKFAKDLSILLDINEGMYDNLVRTLHTKGIEQSDKLKNLEDETTGRLKESKKAYFNQLISQAYVYQTLLGVEDSGSHREILKFLEVLVGDNKEEVNKLNNFINLKVGGMIRRSGAPSGVFALLGTDEDTQPEFGSGENTEEVGLGILTPEQYNAKVKAHSPRAELLPDAQHSSTLMLVSSYGSTLAGLGDFDGDSYQLLIAKAGMLAESVQHTQQELMTALTLRDKQLAHSTTQDFEYSTEELEILGIEDDTYSRESDISAYNEGIEFRLNRKISELETKLSEQQADLYSKRLKLENIEEKVMGDNRRWVQNLTSLPDFAFEDDVSNTEIFSYISQKFDMGGVEDASYIKDSVRKINLFGDIITTVHSAEVEGNIYKGQDIQTILNSTRAAGSREERDQIVSNLLDVALTNESLITSLKEVYGENYYDKAKFELEGILSHAEAKSDPTELLAYYFGERGNIQQGFEGLLGTLSKAEGTVLNPYEFEAIQTSIGEGGSKLIGSAYNTFIPLLERAIFEQSVLTATETVGADQLFDDPALQEKFGDIEFREQSKERFYGTLSTMTAFQQLVRDALKAKSGSKLQTALGDIGYQTALRELELAKQTTDTKRIQEAEQLVEDTLKMALTNTTGTPIYARHDETTKAFEELEKAKNTGKYEAVREKEREAAEALKKAVASNENINTDHYMTVDQMRQAMGVADGETNPLLSSYFQHDEGITAFGALLTFSDYTKTQKPEHLSNKFINELGLEKDFRLTGQDAEDYIADRMVDLLERTEAAYKVSTIKGSGRDLAIQKAVEWANTVDSSQLDGTLAAHQKSLIDSYQELVAEGNQDKAKLDQVLLGELIYSNIHDRNKRTGALDIDTVKNLRENLLDEVALKERTGDEKDFLTRLSEGGRQVTNVIYRKMARGHTINPEEAVHAMSFQFENIDRILHSLGYSPEDISNMSVTEKKKVQAIISRVAPMGSFQGLGLTEEQIKEIILVTSGADGLDSEKGSKIRQATAASSAWFQYSENLLDTSRSPTERQFLIESMEGMITERGYVDLNQLNNVDAAPTGPMDFEQLISSVDYINQQRIIESKNNEIDLLNEKIRRAQEEQSALSSNDTSAGESVTRTPEQIEQEINSYREQKRQKEQEIAEAQQKYEQLKQEAREQQDQANRYKELEKEVNQKRQEYEQIKHEYEASSDENNEDLRMRLNQAEAEYQAAYQAQQQAYNNYTGGGPNSPGGGGGGGGGPSSGDDFGGGGNTGLESNNNRNLVLRPGFIEGDLFGGFAAASLFALATNEGTDEERLGMLAFDVTQGYAELLNESNVGSTRSNWNKALSGEMPNRVSYNFTLARIKQMMEQKDVVAGAVSGFSQELIYRGVNNLIQPAISRAFPIDSSATTSRALLGSAGEILGAVASQSIARLLTGVQSAPGVRSQEFLGRFLGDFVEQVWQTVEQIQLNLLGSNYEVIDTSTNQSLDFEATGKVSDFEWDLISGFLVMGGDDTQVNSEAFDSEPS